MKYNLSDVAVLVIGICLLFVALHKTVGEAGLLWLAMLIVGGYAIGVFVCSGTQENDNE